jgi:DeoR family transcriptional regulator, glycerol-3-phosphate regulon repressor
MKPNVSKTNLSSRHQDILEMARQKGFLSTEELTKALNVTSQTIRRDINELCDRGMLKRYHGGAGLASSIQNVDYSARQVLNHVEKIGIAEMVSRQIPDNASLFINIGTTTEAVAKALSGHKNLRVITNNLNVAALLCSNPDFEVIVAGGVVRSDRGVIGESTIDFIRQFKVDYGIIGTSGIDEDGTLLDFDYREVRVAQAIIENARQVFLATDHTKFSRNAMVRLCHITEIDALFTDRPPPERILASLNEAKIRLYVAGSAADSELP